jgi:hypothetical protein
LEDQPFARDDKKENTVAHTETFKVRKTEIDCLTAAGREHEADHLRSCPICIFGFNKMVEEGLAPAEAVRSLFQKTKVEEK